jgi:hypothetical protein
MGPKNLFISLSCFVKCPINGTYGKYFSMFSLSASLGQMAAGASKLLWAL